MANHFKDIKLNKINSWRKIFQDIPLFQPIIEDIFHKENLPLSTVTNLTPGSNAVFRIGDYVIKIYVPVEVEALYGDFETELNAMILAEKSGVLLPRIVAQGYYEDVFEFPFIIMEYAMGEEADKALKSYNLMQKQRFINDLNRLLEKLNVAVPFDSPFKASENTVANHRWDMFPESLRTQVSQLRLEIDLRIQVLVHGDLTGENVLLDKGRLKVIDFGDTRRAPAYYEYAPIVFDLLSCDPEMVQMFAEDKDDFEDNLFRSLILHEFGAYIIKDLCQWPLNMNPDAFTDLAILKDLIRSMLA